MAASSRGSRRTFETAFLLSAALSDDYKATFALAKETMADMRKEYIEDAQTMAEKTADAFDAAEAAILATGVIDGIRAVAGAYRECIDVASEFEYTMSGVEAVSMASSEDMVLLSEMARELGAETVFTAIQSGDAMTYMAQAGWNAQEMLAGMPGVINMAAASGEDLAMSSSILADVLAGFQMEASESARAADVLAMAAAASNTSVLEMGETFKTSSALAGALGYTIEEVSAAVGLMANVGIKGSQAGTTLRNILNGLLGGATLSGAAFGDVEFSGVNSDGTVKGFKQTIDELRVLFSRMTEAEKILNAKTLAGERGYTGLIGILEATDEQYQEMYDSMSNAAWAAERMAKIRMDNLTGDVTLLKSAFEGLEITLGGQFQEDARGVVQWLTDMVVWTDEFVDSHPAAVKAFTAITAGVAGMAGAMTLMVGAISLFKALGGLTALFTHPAVLAVSAIAGLTATVVALAVTSRKEYQGILDANEELIESHRALNEEYTLALSEIETTYSETGYLAEQVIALAEAENRSAAEKQQLAHLVDELNRKMPELGLVYDRNTDSLNMSTEALQGYIEKMYEEEKQLERMQRLQDLYTQNRGYGEQITTVESELASAEKEKRDLLAIIKEEGLSVELGVKLQEADQKIRDMAEELRVLRANYAASSWEYEAMTREAEANAKPSEAAEAAVVDNSSGDTNIYFNTDGSWTKEDYLKAMKETGMEITEATIATLDDYFAGRMVY